MHVSREFCCKNIQITLLAIKCIRYGGDILETSEKILVKFKTKFLIEENVHKYRICRERIKCQNRMNNVL